ncbi:MAG: alpha/beta hydrolase [Deltaproteobacteria bacterium]|uniref:Alpha/beta hydrolase n=1 Tax=Candidatus Zymogenus saltonus TaxID=2844893 RepID=A0A9D8KG00_9DELT|nr:alpha/beta hydrolase [Candidatus Zymogenus saltonus]
MPKVDRSGVKIDYEVVGTGKKEIVLINGMGRDRNSWIMQRHALSERFTLILYDHRGCGKSDSPKDGYDMPNLVEDLKSVIEAAGFKRPVLMGVSMGGIVAQSFAVTYPDSIGGLVLISTSAGKPGLGNLTKRFEQYVKDMPDCDPEERVKRGLTLIFSLEFVEKNREAIDALIPGFMESSASPEVYNELLPRLKDYSIYDKLNSIKVPVLVLAGDADAIVDPENTRELARVIPGAREIIYPGAGHGLVIERYEDLNRDVIDFISKLDEKKQ